MKAITENETREIIKQEQDRIEEIIKEGGKVTQTIIREKDKVTTIAKIEPVNGKATSSKIVTAMGEASVSYDFIK